MIKTVAIVACCLLFATAADALTSRDLCPVDNPCDQHFLEWRPVPLDSWIIVGPPLPLSPTTHPQVTGTFRGVKWTGFPDFGEYRAKTMRARLVSDPSNVIDLGPELPPEPVPAPQLLSMLWRWVTS